MKILAVETSGQACSCAVAEDGKVICEIYLLDSFTHSRKLMPMVEECLKKAACDVKDIDVFACTSGPGSFTGLRIGICTAKGMAEALQRPMVLAGSLEVLARAVPHGRVISLIDARNDNVYAGLFADGVPLRSMTGRYDEVLSAFGAAEGDIFVGDGAVRFRERILEAVPGAVTAGEEFAYPRAGVLAKLAYDMALEGKTVRPADAEPEYMRPSQAERMKKDNG